MWAPVEVLGCLLSNSSRILEVSMFLPILNGSCGRVECGLLPVNISNGDGRVELMGVVLYEPIHRIVSNAWSKNDTKTVLKFNFFPDSFQNTSTMSEQLLFCIISIKLLTFEEKGNTTKIKFSLVYCCFCTKMQEIL